jgi:EpsI family protein
VAIVFSILAASLCWQGRVFNTASQAGVIMELPYRYENFWGMDEAASEAEKRILPEDTKVLRKSYDATSGESIQLSIVLSGGEKRSIHQPETCLPAQGWTIQRREIIKVPLPNGAELPVMKLELSREVQVAEGKRQTFRSYYLYWFVGKDKTTPSHWDRVFYTSWDRIFHRLNHQWAYVSVSSLVSADYKPGGLNAEQTLEMMKKFISGTAPSFHKPGVLPSKP